MQRLADLSTAFFGPQLKWAWVDFYIGTVVSLARARQDDDVHRMGQSGLAEANAAMVAVVQMTIDSTDCASSPSSSRSKKSIDMSTPLSKEILERVFTVVDLMTPKHGLLVWEQSTELEPVRLKARLYGF